MRSPHPLELGTAAGLSIPKFVGHLSRVPFVEGHPFTEAVFLQSLALGSEGVVLTHLLEVELGFVDLVLQ
jgi:hypothetical protein